VTQTQGYANYWYALSIADESEVQQGYVYENEISTTSSRTHALIAAHSLADRVSPRIHQSA